MIFFSCVSDKSLRDVLHAYTPGLLFTVHLCLFARVDSCMHKVSPQQTLSPACTHAAEILFWIYIPLHDILVT